MRTYDEINADIANASSVNDAERLVNLADEMKSLGTPEAEAVAADSLGKVFTLRGDYSIALDHYGRSLTQNQELGNRKGVAIVNAHMAIVFLGLGDYRSSMEHNGRALDILEELGDKVGVATLTGNMGNVYNDVGDYPKALEHYSQALAVHEEVGELVNAATNIANMGTVYRVTRDYASALDHYRRALVINEDMGNLPGVAMSISNIGIAYAEAGDHELAFEHFKKALSMQEQLGNSAGVARVTGNMIMSLIDTDQIDEADQLLDHQAKMELQKPVTRAYHRVNRAKVCEHQGDLDTARDHLNQALEIVEKADLKFQSVEIHKLLRDLAQLRNDFNEYVEHNNAFLQINEEIRGKEATQKIAVQEAERSMEVERRERDKERALLYGTLPESVAKRIIGGEVIEDHFNCASVLFTDVVGFTTKSGSMHPTSVIKLLEELFRHFDQICDQYSVTKVKTIGDSYLCFKGDETAEANASAVAKVALAMHEHTTEWPSGEPLLNRIGIHSGSVSAGVIGTQRLQYDIWGDTVNTASRMESTGEPGRIQASEDFASALRENDQAPGTRHQALTKAPGTRHPALRERGEVSIKGKGTMTTFWLERG